MMDKPPATIVRLPVGDIRFPTSAAPFWTAEQLKGVLVEFGFTFLGPVDEEGFQDATLPEEWGIARIEAFSTERFIVDDKGRIRIRVIKKIPWGNMDWVHFMFLEYGVPFAKDPREGW